MDDSSRWVCTLSRRGRLACLGINVQGALTWDEFSSTTFLLWGDPAKRYTNVATGFGGQICARQTDGQIFCAGNFVAPDGVEVVTNTPVLVGSGKTVRIDLNDFKVKIDDPAVFRAEDGDAGSVIGANGLLLLSGSPTSFGVPGKVVAGNSNGGGACWLDTAGGVTCQDQPVSGNPNPPPVPAFTQGKAIYLSGTITGDPLCAVFNDGSLWCKGTTPMGTFAAETQVAPPGSLPHVCI